MVKKEDNEKAQKTHSSAFVNLLIRALDDNKLRAELAADVEAALKGVDLGGALTKDEVAELRAIFTAIAPGHVHHDTYACPYRGYS
ncbi:MAG: hypothetical protein KC486_32120 [Myxococcales bacterium]|nr:hypothetical protein [Myxococcales bacterium]